MKYIYRVLSTVLFLFGLTMIIDSFGPNVNHLSMLAIASLISSGLFSIADAVRSNQSAKITDSACSNQSGQVMKCEVKSSHED